MKKQLYMVKKIYGKSLGSYYQHPGFWGLLNQATRFITADNLPHAIFFYDCNMVAVLSGTNYFFAGSNEPVAEVITVEIEV